MNTLSKHDGRMLICSDIDQMNRFYVFAFSFSSRTGEGMWTKMESQSYFFLRRLIQSMIETID